jgi:hypothetical protein
VEVSQLARMPVGIALSKQENRETVFVVCDDGAVFYWDQMEGVWGGHKAVSGTEADEAEEK